jgi:hypothetical protein
MPEFAELERIFMDVRAVVALPENDFSWSSWIDADQALAEVESIIEKIRQGKLPVNADVMFLPTGPLQELSLSSGWGDEFIVLASRFDAAKK